MPKAHNPRHGSMQFWPRVRSKRIYTRVKKFLSGKEANLQGFAGYKVGMTHIIITDGQKNSMTKGEDISVPVTVVECPPVKIAGVRFYKKQYKSIQPSLDILAKTDKELAKKLSVVKSKESNKKIEDVKSEDFDELRILVQTQPKLTGIGKKKPEIFEINMGGNKEDKLAFVKNNLGKEISVKDVFKEGQVIDIHGVTKGKGFQGPVKRFGVKIRAAKAEKTKRAPGSLGGWISQGHVMYRVAHAGQMGFHSRVEYNKKIMMIGEDPEKVNVKGGFLRYGKVKNEYLLLKGSIPGSSKRMIRLQHAARPGKSDTAPQTIQHISTASKQGN